MSSPPDLPFPSNPPAQGIPYYTPEQTPTPGSALSTTAAIPTLFTPLKIRSMTLPHRIAVSPMCTYSCSPADSRLTDFHLAHHGSFALRGCGLTIIEATAVQPRGRISPQDAGLWNDDQIPGLKRVADLVHGLGGQKVGIQLAHAGRKASTVTSWAVFQQREGDWEREPVGLARRNVVASKEDDGWPDDVVGPTDGLSYGEGFPVPRGMTLEEIWEVIGDFVAAAKRAVEAGVDMVEVHGAHGYLITEFLSPLTNKRTDQYGGSFENRTRLLKEVVVGVREVIPDTMPLWVRVSATEWAEGGWDVNDTIELAKQLPTLGVDVLDVSSGGNVSHQDIPTSDRQFQTRIAGKIRKALRNEGLEMLVAAVGLVKTAEAARDVVQMDEKGEATADIVLAARQFLKEPEWVLRVAHKLGVEVKWVSQYHRAIWIRNEDIHPSGSR